MRRLASLIVILCCVAIGIAAASAADSPKPKPTVEKYDHATDDFVFRHSAATAGAPSRNKERFYAGSTLNRFLFRGLPGRGGIYDALERYYQERKLDPQKYECR
ncbi:MAG: hypothetical protein HYS13_17270 [Planctomycetia bacterium]|nr:hypothetical protein [Planctomycetia bacterium]